MRLLKHALRESCNMFFNCTFTLPGMSTIGERVARAITESNASVKDVAHACGVTVQAVYAWRRGEIKDIRNEHLFELADITGFDARWLGTGKGPERTITDEREKALLDLYRACDDRGQATVFRAAEQESVWTVSTEDKAGKVA